MSPTRPGTMGGSSATLTLTTLLYLGELWGKRWDEVPSPPRFSSLRDPRTQRGSVGTELPEEETHSQPQVWPQYPGPQNRPGVSVWGWGLFSWDSFLGLCRGSWDLVQAGVLPKPTIWADPSPVVTSGSLVTIWCQGSLQADAYYLYKEGISEPLAIRTLEDSSNRTGFRTESASSVTAGRYQCAYYTKRNGWSEQSDLLPLVVTGFFRAPSLSAHPSPVVASGRNVFLLCSSESTSGTFHLLKERGADPPQHMESKWWPDTRRWQALFPMGPTNTSHGGTYRCYGSQSSYVYQWSWPSDPLRLEVTGVYKEPSLSAQPGMLVLSGELLSLQCHSEAGFDRFALTKDEGLTPPQCLDGQHSPNFPLGPVTRSLAGQYRCYSGHNLSYAWSAPSAPLDILVTGMYKKPSLSAQPGPSVPWGGKVTLQCHSQTLSDTFYLHKEGSPAPPQHFRPPDTAASFQANFTMNPVTSAHGGTYRCYSSWSTSPYLLSHPSDPVEFVVSGLKRYLNILIGVLVALVLLFSLLLFLLLRHWRQRKCRMSTLAQLLTTKKTCVRGPGEAVLGGRTWAQRTWVGHRSRE
ncbi:leukocyte immunoglobulin-like receptor subfamily A member 6 isoform X5 [Rousettus aegyptiacus]|uniref:leukocyte immunoglobulin-like receptor subfamily A member 6 isoform X5 n=1 Tax=Rousettus aegyptiacus TaxID=9407 RepID=UPI00168D2D39|nr:leukocyte immunoglobulin-like receptor subfamily A member 6 isoform X5 [Rousettus aegyptiacus]